jgi:hypothetical protein
MAMTSQTNAHTTGPADTPASPRRSSTPPGPQGTAHAARPHGAPAYYLGRPASVWLAAFRCKRQAPGNGFPSYPAVVGIAAQPLADPEPVHVGQRDVEDDDIAPHRTYLTSPRRYGRFVRGR